MRVGGRREQKEWEREREGKRGGERRERREEKGRPNGTAEQTTTGNVNHGTRNDVSAVKGDKRRVYRTYRLTPISLSVSLSLSYASLNCNIT